LTRKRSTARGVKAAELGRHLVLTARRVQQLAEEGIFPRLSNGTFDQDQCRTIYIKYLQDAGRRVVHSDSRERAQAAKTELLELKTARERGDLILFADTEEVFADVLGSWRSELSGVPAGCTRDLTLRTTIEEQINDAAERAQRRFDAACAALRAGVEIGVEDDETSA
jgi:phage terminase Nu1 subunit (DNA packaging protein)